MRLGSAHPSNPRQLMRAKVRADQPVRTTDIPSRPLGKTLSLCCKAVCHRLPLLHTRLLGSYSVERACVQPLFGIKHSLEPGKLYCEGLFRRLRGIPLMLDGYKPLLCLLESLLHRLDVAVQVAGRARVM